MNETTRIIEINGVKVEVDLRNAKVLTNYAVGDRCKVLTKNYSGYQAKYGVIVDISEFKQLPTIELLVVDPGGYQDALEFISFNAKTDEVEIAPLNYLDEFFAKETIIERFDRERSKLEKDLMDLERKRELFLRHFGKYFENKETEATNDSSNS